MNQNKACNEEGGQNSNSSKSRSLEEQRMFSLKMGKRVRGRQMTVVSNTHARVISFIFSDGPKKVGASPCGGERWRDSER